MLKTVIIRDAPTVWNNLNGIINVFKPAGIKVSHVRAAVIANLCRDLNELEVRPTRKLIDLDGQNNNKYLVKAKEDFSDHILAVGPRYQIKDVKCGSAAPLGIHSSGVLLLGINRGLRFSTKIHFNRPIRVYHVSGELGIATETNFIDSRILTKATYKHINVEQINRLVSSVQASHQKKMFELCSLDIQSQAAYELAVKGTIRPASNSVPMIYGIKCINFASPSFTLEIHALNENEEYLATLIQEIGLQLHSVAHCTGIRCIRHGHFTIDDALLRRHWTLQNILTNMTQCKKLIKMYPTMLRQTNSNLVAEK